MGNVTNQGESSLESQCPGFTLGTSQVDIPHLAGKQALSRIALLCLHKQFRYTELPLSFRVVGILLKSKFPDASQGPTLQAGLSKDKQSQAC